ncbi:hypothetical protein QJS04_geneDACA019173 [Acorus gramineus]|uniref:Uncharacterized protein n=1 Tax=Acorus gramineus TaxID=55184 RepID=A0AAV9BDG4_ACOGR|nr:hypothetical protein QJS04_geneDACA019173 [Acorus gramineus]
MVPKPLPFPVKCLQIDFFFFSFLREAHMPREAGMGPVKLLELRSRTVREAVEETMSEKGPERLAPETTRWVREERTVGGGGGVELYGLDGDVGDEVSEGTQSGKDVEKFWIQERRARDSGFWVVDGQRERLKKRRRRASEVINGGRGGVV